MYVVQLLKSVGLWSGWYKGTSVIHTHSPVPGPSPIPSPRLASPRGPRSCCFAGAGSSIWYHVTASSIVIIAEDLMCLVQALVDGSQHSVCVLRTVLYFVQPQSSAA